jgi:hypothetical protein
MAYALHSGQSGAVSLTGRERSETFLAWADECAGGTEAQYNLFSDGGQPSITSIWYPDTPEPEWSVGVTYGMSLLHGSSAELIVVVQSRDPSWIHALAFFVDRERSGMSEFGLDDTIRWGEPISEQSGMDAFYIASAVGALEDGDVVHLADDDHVHLLRAIPLYSSELPLVREIGGAAFAERVRGDLLDPHRPAVQ